jgi:hypothetical protein
MVMAAEERPPYVTFEWRPVEDRTLSQASGRWMSKDVAFVIITPQGSKDRIERVADDWLKEKAAHAEGGRFSRSWYEAYRRHYEMWLKDEEPIVDGTPLRSWPILSPSQYKTLRDLRILTVEDLAIANEETIGRIGPGARSLKSQAGEWLAQAKDIGMPVAEAERLRGDNAALRQQIDALTLQVNELSGRLQVAMQMTGIEVNGAERSVVDEALEGN